MKKLISFLLLAVYIPLTVLASVTVTVNGTNHTIPQTNERGWGNNVTGWIQDISADVLYPTGGNFTLGADVDWGGSFGHKSAYYKSRSSSPSDAGVLRLGNAQSLGWRNNADSGNLLLTVNSSDQLTYNGIILSGSDGVSVDDSTFTIFDDGDSTKEIAFQASGITTGTTRTITMPDANVDLGGLTNSNIDGSAAIAYSKLNLTGSVLNADINSSAAIDATKIHDGSISNTEFGYLNGLTSAIQDQIDNINPSTISQTGNVDLNFVDEDTTDNDNGVVLRTNCTDTGSGTEDCDFSIRQQIAGTETAVITSNADGGITLGLPVYAANGSITDPGLGFLEGSAIGFWRAGNTIAMGVNGVQVYIASTGELQLNQVARLQDAAQSSTVPGLVGASADDNTGVSLPGSDNLHLISGGVELARGSGGTTFDFKVQPTYNGLPIGGSSGGGLQLFSDAEADTHSNLVAYDDTNEAPTDLTGTDTSTSGLTISAESTEELGLSAESYQMDWSAADNQGVGAAITADPSQMPRIATTGPTPVTVEFDYESSGLTSTDGVEVWVYRIGSNLIQNCYAFVNGSATNHLMEATNGATYRCQIDLSSSDTGLRIGFHRDQTTATAINLVVDNIKVTAGASPVFGLNRTDRETFTPTWNNVTVGNATQEWRRWRDGDKACVSGLFVFGSTSSFSGTVTMDNPFPGTTAVNLNSNHWHGEGVGMYDANNSANRQTGMAYIRTDGTIGFLGQVHNTLNASAPFAYATGDVLQVGEFCFQIQEWEVGNQYSPYEYGRKRAKARVQTAPTTNIASATNTFLHFTTVDYDPFGMVTIGTDHDTTSATNGTYVTVPYDGKMRINGRVVLDDSTNFSGTELARLRVAIDGSSSGTPYLDFRYPASNEVDPPLAGSVDIEVSAGQKVEVFIRQESGAAIPFLADGARNYLEFEMLNDETEYGVRGIYEIVSTESSGFDMTTAGYATAEWAQMTGNSVSLDPGTWKVCGYYNYAHTTATTTLIRTRYSEANGDNTTSLPTDLGTSAFEILHGNAGYHQIKVNTGGTSLDDFVMSAPCVVVRNSSTASLYYNISATFSAVTSASLFTNIIAERLQ